MTPGAGGTVSRRRWASATMFLFSFTCLSMFCCLVNWLPVCFFWFVGEKSRRMSRRRQEYRLFVALLPAVFALLVFSPPAKSREDSLAAALLWSPASFSDDLQSGCCRTSHDVDSIQLRQPPLELCSQLTSSTSPSPVRFESHKTPSEVPIPVLPVLVSGYFKSTGTKLFSGGSRKDLSPTCLANHTSCLLRAKSVSLNGFGLSPRTPLATSHTDKCSLLLSFLDFTDQWLNSVSFKSSCFWYGNAGRGSVCLNSLLASLESIVKLISLSVGVKGKCFESSHPWFLVTGVDTQQLYSLISSYPVPKSEQPSYVCGVPRLTWRFAQIYKQVLNSEVHAFLPGAISRVNPESLNKVHHQHSTLTRAGNESLLLAGQCMLRIEDCSPLAIFLTTMARQISSCQGHERSFSPILLFVGVNLSTKTPLLYERYLSLGIKAKEYCRFPNRLLSCVMVRLGPEDITRFISMRLEVVERSTSRYTVTILKSENFEGRSTFSMRLFASGSFELNFDSLSNLYKFVSLSLFYFALEISKKKQHIVCSMLPLSV